MEARKIIITSTRSSSKKVIETGAETLGELKAALDQAGIDYDGLTFYEGLSKTELKSDESILPKDVPYKGNITNNLVFLLTNPDKKIASGSYSRNELYTVIKEQGLQEEVKNTYGKNFTLCTTAQLAELVSKHNSTEEPKAEVAPVSTICKDEPARNAILEILDILENDGTLYSDDADSVRATLSKDEPITRSNNAPDEVKEEQAPAIESPYSDEEIDKLFS